MKIDKVTEIATLMVNNPKIKADDVAKKFKVSKTYAYNLMTKARKKVNDSPFGQGQGKPKLRMQSVVDRLAPTTPTDEEIAKANQIRKEIVQTHHTDMVNHPPHYTAGGIETIDFIEAKSLGYNLGNVVKYITRADHKGDKHEDLCKARWYLNREIAKLAK